MKKILTALALCALPLSAAQAQTSADGMSATATGTAGVTYIQPLTLSHDMGSAISFGQVMATTVDGTVAVDYDGTTTKSTACSVYFFNGSRASADSFTVTGEPNKAISITLPEPST